MEGLISFVENKEPGNGRLRLHEAVRFAIRPLIRRLVATGGNIDAQDELGFAPIHIACIRGFTAVLLDLIHLDADVNITDCAGNTPLHIACRFGASECVEALLSNGADFNLVNHLGETPAHCACRCATVDSLQCLLRRRAVAAGAKTRLGDTLLHIASSNVECDVINILLASTICSKAISERNLAGDMPLHLACKSRNLVAASGLLRFATERATDLGPIIDAQAEREVDLVNTPGAMGRYPLHLAVRSKDTSLVRLLLKEGASSEARDAYGRTALFEAIMLENFDISLMLLVHGSDPNTKDGSHMSAMHVCVSKENAKLLALLAAFGGDEDLSDAFGVTVSQSMRQSSNVFESTVLGLLKDIDSWSRRWMRAYHREESYAKRQADKATLEYSLKMLRYRTRLSASSLSIDPPNRTRDTQRGHTSITRFYVDEDGLEHKLPLSPSKEYITASSFPVENTPITSTSLDYKAAETLILITFDDALPPQTTTSVFRLGSGRDDQEIDTDTCDGLDSLSSGAVSVSSSVASTSYIRPPKIITFKPMDVSANAPEAFFLHDSAQAVEPYAGHETEEDHNHNLLVSNRVLVPPLEQQQQVMVMNDESNVHPSYVFEQNDNKLSDDRNQPPRLSESYVRGLSKLTRRNSYKIELIKESRSNASSGGGDDDDVSTVGSEGFDGASSASSVIDEASKVINSSLTSEAIRLLESSGLASSTFRIEEAAESTASKDSASEGRSTIGSEDFDSLSSSPTSEINSDDGRAPAQRSRTDSFPQSVVVRLAK